MAAAQDIPGAKAVYEELKTLFPGGKRKTGETKTETVTEILGKKSKLTSGFFDLKTTIFELRTQNRCSKHGIRSLELRMRG
jgi:hypothetical protein